MPPVIGTSTRTFHMSFAFQPQKTHEGIPIRSRRERYVPAGSFWVSVFLQLHPRVLLAEAGNRLPCLFSVVLSAQCIPHVVRESVCLDRILRNIPIVLLTGTMSRFVSGETFDVEQHGHILIRRSLATSLKRLN